MDNLTRHQRKVDELLTCLKELQRERRESIGREYAFAKTRIIISVLQRLLEQEVDFSAHLEDDYLNHLRPRAKPKPKTNRMRATPLEHDEFDDLEDAIRYSHSPTLHHDTFGLHKNN